MHACVKEVVDVTPRQERIGHDYGQEFPKVLVESRRVTSAGPERTTAAARSTDNNLDIMNIQDEVSPSHVILHLCFTFFKSRKP